MTKYVVTNGKGEYLHYGVNTDYGATKANATIFGDKDRAESLADMGNILNYIGNAPDTGTNPYEVVEA